MQIDNRSALARYLQWLAEKNYSEATIKGRRIHLGYFIAWCEERQLQTPQEITKPILERYQRYLFHYRKKRDGEPLSVRSQHSRTVPVRAFFKWLTQQNYLLYNPASELTLPKKEQRLPKHTLSPSEVETILNTPDTNTAMGIKSRTILETFYSTGIRRTELCNLKCQDIDYSRGTVMIRQGKGRKDRMIPIGDRALKWLDKYIHETRPQYRLGDDDDTLFLSKQGIRYKPEHMTSLVSNVIKEANIGKTGSCHLFRHTMATLMLENGADIRYIQAILGHVSLETTQIYTQVSIKKLKEVHTLTHPAKLKHEEQTEGE